MMIIFCHFLAICAITRPSYALIIGLIGGVVACASCKVLERLHIDDPVSCVPVHFCSGVWSLIAVAFFLEKDKSGSFSSEYTVIHDGRWKLLGAQVTLIVATGAWSALLTFFLLTIIDCVIPIRLSLADELKGSDKCEHGISLSCTFETSVREHSAYGTRTLSRTDSKNQGSSIEAGSLSPATSNQSTSTGNATSATTNQCESENGSVLTHRSPSHISDEPFTIIVHNQQTNGQTNIAFNTDL